MKYETKLYTSVWEFRALMSYDEVIKKIEEGNGTLILTREWKGQRVENGEVFDVDSIVTTRLNTNKVEILCYEEFAMTDIEVKPKK